MDGRRKRKRRIILGAVCFSRLYVHHDRSGVGGLVCDENGLCPFNFAGRGHSRVFNRAFPLILFSDRCWAFYSGDSCCESTWTRCTLTRRCSSWTSRLPTGSERGGVRETIQKSTHSIKILLKNLSKKCRKNQKNFIFFVSSFQDDYILPQNNSNFECFHSMKCPRVLCEPINQ